MYRYSMTVNGTQRRDGDGTLPVRDPATGQVCGEAPQCSPAVLDEAMEAGRLAGPSWSRDEAERRNCLRQLAVALRANRDELAAIITAEQGKPLPDARAEVERSAECIWYYV
jgi:acyl-CoA reductase-like NAD-dependent aldehyde dehydrogenase